MANWAKWASKRTEGSFHSSGQVVACTRVRGRWRWRSNNALCIKWEVCEHSWLATRITGLPLLSCIHTLYVYTKYLIKPVSEFQSMMSIFIYIHIYLFCHKGRQVIITWVWQQSHYSEQKGHVSHPESVPA